jgi:hypothetical protein
VRTRVAWCVVAAGNSRRYPRHGLHGRSQTAAERSDMGATRLAPGAASRCRMRRDGRSDRLAPPHAHAGVAAVRRKPALSHPGRRCLHRLGSRGERPRVPTTGPTGSPGPRHSWAGRLLRARHGFPHLTNRAFVLARLAVGCLGNRGRSRPAHRRNAHHQPWRLRLRRAVRRSHRVDCVAHDGVPPDRRRPESPQRSASCSAFTGQGTTSGANCCGSRHQLCSWR